MYRLPFILAFFIALQLFTAPAVNAAYERGPLDISELAVTGGTIAESECGSTLNAASACTLSVVATTVPAQLTVGTDRGTTTHMIATTTQQHIYIRNASEASVTYGTGTTDIIYGDQEPNQIWARGGDDIIVPGDGQNQLVGGAGNDTFVGYENNGTFIMDSGSGVDTIHGYLAGSDRIQLPPRVNGANAYYEGRAVLRQTYNTVDGVRVPLGNGNEVLLTDIRKRELRASDFYIGELPTPPPQRTRTRSSTDSDQTDDTDQQPQAPTLFFSLFPSELDRGETGTLTWSATNAERCSASGAWSGSRELIGSQRITPTSSVVYRLTCRTTETATTSSISLTFAPRETESATDVPPETTPSSEIATTADSGRSDSAVLPTASPVEAATSTRLRFDLTDDGVVNSGDQNALIRAWGARDAVRGDLNDDGAVNAIDYSLLNAALE
jgi:cell division septation protein DedD